MNRSTYGGYVSAGCQSAADTWRGEIFHRGEGLSAAAFHTEDQLRSPGHRHTANNAAVLFQF